MGQWEGVGRSGSRMMFMGWQLLPSWALYAYTDQPRPVPSELVQIWDDPLWLAGASSRAKEQMFPDPEGACRD